MSDLEREVVELRRRLDDLAERVRVSVVAQRFIAGDHAVRDGDYARFSDGHASRVDICKGSGKWSYRNRFGQYCEAHRVPPEDGIERLYTIAEVAEILARAIPKMEAALAALERPPPPPPPPPRPPPRWLTDAWTKDGPAEAEAVLDGKFTADELEAIARHMRANSKAAP